MRILCREEKEIRDQNIVDMAAADIIQQRELQERMRVELVIKCKDLLSVCIDNIINKLKVERRAVRGLQGLLQRSFDGVLGMVEDASTLTDGMRDALTRSPLVGNEVLLEALKNQEGCVACIQEWMSRAQDWHQRNIKKLELFIESQSTAIEEYLDRQITIDDWDFEKTSTSEAMMPLASAMDMLEQDSNVICAVFPDQLIEPFPVVSFCKEDPAPFGTAEANAQVSQAFQKLGEWQAEAAQTFCDVLDTVTSNILRDSAKVMTVTC